jgi:hypothetical protein
MTGAAAGRRFACALAAERPQDHRWAEDMIFVLEVPHDDQRAAVIELGTIAAASRTSIYALRLGDQLFQSMASEKRAPMASMDDRYARRRLELLSSASRAPCSASSAPAAVFEHIESELSSYYLLGVESSPADRRQDIRCAWTCRQEAHRALAPPLVGNPVPARPERARTGDGRGQHAAADCRAAAARHHLLAARRSRQDGRLVHADIGTDYAAPAWSAIRSRPRRARGGQPVGEAGCR